MFSFAIWDHSKQEMFLARDHFGIKPLYYSQNNGVIVFGSEAKGLLDIVPGSRNIDHTAFTCWNISGLNVSNHSFFKGIKNLLPKTILMEIYQGLEKKFQSLKVFLVVFLLS